MPFILIWSNKRSVRCFSFFFQAEDGIRDVAVTGVQTCALPISANRAELDLPARFTDPSVQRNVALDLALIDTYDAQVADLELYLTRTAKVDDAQADRKSVV